MRKENATKWKPFLSSQRDREGCHFGRELKAEVTKPKADSQRLRSRTVPETEAPEREWGPDLRETPTALASTGHGSGRVGSAHLRKPQPGLPAPCRGMVQGLLRRGPARALLFGCCIGTVPVVKMQRERERGRGWGRGTSEPWPAAWVTHLHTCQADPRSPFLDEKGGA